MRREWQSQLAALRDDLAHRRRATGHALRARQEEEDLKVRGLRHTPPLLKPEQQPRAPDSCGALSARIPMLGFS